MAVRYRRYFIPMVAALAFAAVAGMPALAQPGGNDEPGSATLSLAVWDQPGRQAEQAALDLVAFAPELSEGSIVISDPVWGAADAADLVSTGQVDLAILATREWSPLGVTSLDVLEAPFLIDNDALSLAVATSDVAPEAMSGLEALGVTGLAMWPEDLRHLFAFAASGKTFQSVEEFVDATILAIAGKPGQDLVTTLGGKVYVEGVEVGNLTGDRVWDAQSGELDGMVTGLWGAGLPPSAPTTVAGDLVLYPKYQMLVANSESLARLSDEQRAALDAIVADVHEAALGRHFAEADLAQRLCENGATVIEAGPAAIEELRVAAQPLIDSMASDPLTGRLIERVNDLAKATIRSPGAGTCSPAETVVEGDALASAPVPAGFTGAELVPDGTYRAEVTAAELEAAGAGAFFASINAGVWTMTIDGNGWNVAHDKQNERCSGTQEAVDGSVRFATVVSQGCGMDYDMAWRLEGDALSFRLVDLVWSDDPDVFAEERTFPDVIVWTRIADPGPSGESVAAMPPDGTYRAEITSDDLEARGVNHEQAIGNAGIVTWTVRDGRSILRWESGESAGDECSATISPGDPVVLAFAGDDCDPGEYELTFTVDEDRLLPTVLATIPQSDPNLTRAFFERPWTRID